MKTIIGGIITFGRDGNAWEHETHGWSGREDGFTWSLRGESGLMIQKPDASNGFILEITASPLILPPNLLSQRMIVWANERKVGEVTLRNGGPLGFYVPPLPPEDRSLFIRIEHPDVWVPESWDRDLSIRFISIRILSLVEPYPMQLCQASGVKLSPKNETEVSDIVVAERLTGIAIRELMIAFEALVGN